jgi:hypothetical protein
VDVKDQLLAIYSFSGVVGWLAGAIAYFCWSVLYAHCLAVHQSGRLGGKAHDRCRDRAGHWPVRVCVSIRDTHSTGGVPMRRQASSSGRSFGSPLRTH